MAAKRENTNFLILVAAFVAVLAIITGLALSKGQTSDIGFTREIKNIESQSESTDTQSLEDDLEATDLEAIDADLKTLEAEFEQSLTTD